MFRCLSTILHTFREQRTPDNCLALLAVTMEDLYHVADEVCLLDFKFVIRLASPTLSTLTILTACSEANGSNMESTSRCTNEVQMRKKTH